MQLCVVGCDAELREHCRSVVAELTGVEWDVVSCQSKSEPPESDLYIWDFVPESFTKVPKPEVFKRALFVVEPKSMDLFRQLFGTERASILLKPARPAALRPFLEHAVYEKEHRSAPAGATDRAPGDADDLLGRLLHTNLRLQEYDRWRTNFLARTSHDFRTPLTAISGYCDLLIDQRVGTLKPEQIELLSRMQRSIRRLARLTDALFDLSVSDRVRREPHWQEASVEATVNQVIHEIMPHAERKQIRMTVHLAPPARSLVFDPDKIEQVLLNLLENSCKFTPRGGSIELYGYPVFWNPVSPRASHPGSWSEASAGFTPNAYRFDLRDSGSGVPAEHLESIFEEYTSCDASDRSGGGLGLAICRLIVSAHQGSIWAESDPDGTQFSFVLPYRDAPGSFHPSHSREAAWSPLDTFSA